MRERLPVSKTFSMTEKMSNNIQAIADALNVSFAEVIRECVTRELPKMIDRERKRGNLQKGVKA